MPDIDAKLDAVVLHTRGFEGGARGNIGVALPRAVIPVAAGGVDVDRDAPGGARRRRLRA